MLLGKAPKRKTTPYDIVILFVSQQGTCALCSVDLLVHRFHVDHITPLSKGGRDELNNKQLLCPECNVKKGNREAPEEDLDAVPLKRWNIDSTDRAKCIGEAVFILRVSGYHKGSLHNDDGSWVSEVTAVAERLLRGESPEHVFDEYCDMEEANRIESTICGLA